MEIVNKEKLLEAVAAAAVNQVGGELRIPCLMPDKSLLPKYLEITLELETRCLVVKTL